MQRQKPFSLIGLICPRPAAGRSIYLSGALEAEGRLLAWRRPPEAWRRPALPILADELVQIFDMARFCTEIMNIDPNQVTMAPFGTIL